MRSTIGDRLRPIPSVARDRECAHGDTLFLFVRSQGFTDVLTHIPRHPRIIDVELSTAATVGSTTEPNGIFCLNVKEARPIQGEFDRVKPWNISDEMKMREAVARELPNPYVIDKSVISSQVVGELTYDSAFVIALNEARRGANKDKGTIPAGPTHEFYSVGNHSFLLRIARALRSSLWLAWLWRSVRSFIVGDRKTGQVNLYEHLKKI